MFLILFHKAAVFYGHPGNGRRLTPILHPAVKIHKYSVDFRSEIVYYYVNTLKSGLEDVSYGKKTE
ncbi:hypothetical protein HMPREF3293_02687 [Christensenella minuta]|uniref:Uncharacterized protein n=1 Tax=Christensenella minuta TaxID=626937 RepID=A0A136Q1V7_9FIRM|nr:hypothetical protein HMPREF3293_02687 [Christensenella minuta]